MNGSPAFNDFAVKNLLVYFTGTGNSLAVARNLAKILPDAHIISVADMMKQSLDRIHPETCGFVFPVYCQDVPEILKRLLHKMQFSPDTYIYAIATHNGDVGYSHFTINKILEKKRQHLQAGFAILMPGNSITPYDSTNSEEETLHRLAAAEPQAHQIADDIAGRSNLPYAGTNTLKKHFKGIRNMFRHKIIYKVPQKFRITDSCNGCGLCSRICPENNISVDLASVKWGKHCQMCLACIHWCPKRAIQNGEGTITRKRYHHPDISLDDMICRN